MKPGTSTDARKPPPQQGSDQGKDKGKGSLEKIAEGIDPPSREISDAELIDPGKNIPPGTPDDVNSKPEPTQRKH